MAFLYKVFREEYKNEEQEKYLAYGISIFEISDTQKRCLGSYSDIFLNREEALYFANLCTSEQVEPIHFLDVLEDFLP